MLSEMVYTFIPCHRSNKYFDISGIRSFAETEKDIGKNVTDTFLDVFIGKTPETTEYYGFYISVILLKQGCMSLFRRYALYPVKFFKCHPFSSFLKLS